MGQKRLNKGLFEGVHGVGESGNVLKTRVERKRALRELCYPFSSVQIFIFVIVLNIYVSYTWGNYFDIYKF